MGMEWSYDPSPEKLRQDNDDVLRAVRSAPHRTFGFVYLNPKHTQASLDELNRCVRMVPWLG
jgi:predicted TIM-barrel fold metal-dependent hydrolase